MKRIFVISLAAAALALPAVAFGKVFELGAGAPPAKSNCPADPCEAVYRVTGYQGRAGTVKAPFLIPRAGKIVAFTVTLPKLQQRQIQFFNDSFGSPAQVRLSILRKGKRRTSRLDHRLMAQSKVYRVDHYLGSSPSFALDAPLRVRKGYIVALTVPTWAPALAGKLPRSNWWRSSRKKGDCGTSTELSKPAPQQTIGEVVKYGCTYRGARLLYTATYVPDPRPTDVTTPSR